MGVTEVKHNFSSYGMIDATDFHKLDVSSCVSFILLEWKS